MKHSIKLDDQVYLDLERIREKRETFSEAVERLLRVRYELALIASLVEGSKNYRDWKKEQEDPVRKAMLERAELDTRILKQ